MRSLIKFLFFGSLVVMAVAFWRKDVLPPPVQLLEKLRDEPKQSPVRAQPATVTVHGIQYSIQPRYAYELWGLVVAVHDSETWWDYAHKEWNDYLNVVDLCVVWGDNVRNGSYQSVSFSHSQWECLYSWTAAGLPFDITAVSNNHLITIEPAVARRLRQVRIGDQVRFRGYLADYTTYKDGAPTGTRVSSTVRNDTGNGACEVVYIEDFEILKAGDGTWRTLGKIGIFVFFASIVGWFWLPLRV